MEKARKYNKAGLIWLSALLSAATVTLAFKAAGRFPGDKNIFMVGDYYVQFMNYIVMFWRKLLSGNGLFYSFDVGLGAATWEQYAFYGFSPFNAVFLLISDTDTAAFILFLLKVCAAAVCMHLFLRYAAEVCEQTAVLFSLSYAVCSYVVSFHFCIVFIDYLYLLPIVMLMLNRLFKTGKEGGLAAAYAFSFITAYYGGYMIGVFSLVCFAVKLVCGKNDIPVKTLLLRYFSAVLTAVMISAAVTLPAAMGLISGRAGESGTFADSGLLLTDVITALFPMIKIHEMSFRPALYCGLPALVFSLGYFCDREIKGRERGFAALPLLFLFICIFFKPAYLMIHGFDEPDGYYFRFTFLFAFYITVLGAQWAERKNTGGIIMPPVIVLLIQTAAMCAGFVFPNEGNDRPGLITAAITAVFLLLYHTALRYGGKRRNGLCCLILVTELLLNAYYCITPDSAEAVRLKENYDLWRKNGAEALEEISEAEEGQPEEDFYRVNFRNGLWVNDSMYFGYHGLGYFSSMEQKQTRQLMHDLGYAASNRLVIEKGGSPFTEMIFSQRYRVSTSTDISDPASREVKLKLNEYVLPLGFMVSDAVENVEMENNAFVNQQKVINAMLGHDCDLWKMYSGKVAADSANLLLSMENGKFFVEREKPGEGRLVLSVDTEEGEYYSYISTDFNGFDYTSAVVSSDAEGEKIGLNHSSYLYIPAIIRLGGKKCVYLSMKEGGRDEDDFEKIYFAEFDKEGLKNAFEELKAGGLRISKMKDDDIRGRIKVSGGKNLMFTSIPYDENWHVECDGKEAETLSAMNGAFLACRLPEGEHTIRIYYHNKYIVIGAVITLMGIAALIVMILKEKRHNTGVSGDNDKVAENSSDGKQREG